MPEVLLDYGETRMPVELPEGAVVFTLAEWDDDPPEADAATATRAALADPLGMPRLSESAGPGRKVVIAFPDRVKGGSHPRAHRRVAIPIIVDDLLAAGTDPSDILLLCAPGLHRKNTVEEWRDYLGEDLVDRFLPDLIVNHDAERDVVDLGTDPMGNPVETSRHLLEADLRILIGHCTGNPYGGFSGGSKMLATGLSGRRSIASHHAPGTMHREDWMGASPDSHMRHQFASITRSVESGLGGRIFEVDAVLGRTSQVLGVAAGAIEEVERATWPTAAARTNVALDMEGPADVLVMGLPRDFHYGPGMGTNPILMSLAIAGQLSRCWGAFRKGGVVIAAAQCDGWFNDEWFPSYRETYEALQHHETAAGFLASAEAERIASDPVYLAAYSDHYAYHPFHAMSMISGGAAALLWTSAVYVIGAAAPEFAAGMGLTPVPTFAEALRTAAEHVGSEPRILCTPDPFTGGVGVHLEAGPGSQ